MNTQEYIEKVKTQTNDEYEVLGEYINCDTPIEMKHKVCGYVWNTTTPYCFTRKNKPNRCPQCSKNRRVSNSVLPFNDFIQKIKECNKEKFDVIGEYISGAKPLLIKHKKCGCEFEISKASRLIYSKVLCPECEKPKYRKHESTQWFKDRIYELCEDEYELIGDFHGVDNYVTLKHNICGNIYSSTIGSSFLSGTRCPFCNESKGEKSIQKFLNEFNIDYEQQKTFDDLHKSKIGQSLSYDFYLPKYNLLIEYQGEQHDHPVKYSKNMTDAIAEKRFDKQKENDEKKKDYAEKNNIELLEIWYWDYNNIKDILRRTLNV